MRIKEYFIGKYSIWNINLLIPKLRKKIITLEISTYEKGHLNYLLENIEHKKNVFFTPSQLKELDLLITKKDQESNQKELIEQENKDI